MLDIIRKAVDSMKKAGGNPKTVFLLPTKFKAFHRLVCEAYPGFPDPVDGSFEFYGITIKEHRYLPPGSAYITNLEAADEIFNWRPGV